jgi:hypothetical protein
VYVTRSNTTLATGIKAIPAAIASGGMAAAAVAGIPDQNIPPLIGGGPRFDTNRPSLLRPNKREEEVNILSPPLPCVDFSVDFFGPGSTPVSLCTVFFRALFSIDAPNNKYCTLYCIVFVSFQITHFLHAVKIYK